MTKWCIFFVLKYSYTKGSITNLAFLKHCSILVSSDCVSGPSHEKAPTRYSEELISECFISELLSEHGIVDVYTRFRSFQSLRK